MKKQLKHIAKQDTPDIKDDIKNSHSYQTFVTSSHQQKSKPFFSPLRIVYAGAFSMVIILMVFLTPALNQPVYSEVYIEFNPSFTLNLSDQDTVHQIQGLNDDGVALIHSLGDLEGETLNVALEQLIDQAIDMGFINEDNTIVYDVVGTNTEHHRIQLASLLEDIKTHKLPNMTIMRGMGGMPSESERSISEDYDIGVMHARLIGLVLLEKEDVTIDDLIDLTLPELRAMLNGYDDMPSNTHPRHPFDDGDFPGNRPPTRGPMH